MTEFEFTSTDFEGHDNLYEYELAKLANEKIAPLLQRLNELDEMIEKADIVYGHPRTFWNKKKYEMDTHKAKLIMIEEIK